MSIQSIQNMQGDIWNLKRAISNLEFELKRAQNELDFEMKCRQMDAEYEDTVSRMDTEVRNDVAMHRAAANRWWEEQCRCHDEWCLAHGLPVV